MNRKRVKLAEVTSATGALVLGVGIGILASGPLRSWGIPLLILGLVVHGWGMFDKHRLEGGESGAPIWWETLLYWLCWLFIAGALLGSLVFVLR